VTKAQRNRLNRTRTGLFFRHSPWFVGEYTELVSDLGGVDTANYKTGKG
jgi:hypothetical protein